jgi:hypothetical protein
LLDNLDLYGSAFLETVRPLLIAAIGSLVVGIPLADMRCSSSAASADPRCSTRFSIKALQEEAA